LLGQIDCASMSRVAQLRKECEELKCEKASLATANARLSSLIRNIHSKDSNDTVVLSFPDADGPDRSRKCSRMLLCQWSSAFEVLMRHGNQLGNDFPEHIELKDVEMSTFQVVFDFQCSGQLKPDMIEGETQCEHPVLQFADRFDLLDLKRDYLALALQKVPLNCETVVWHLNLATAGNDAEMKEKCIRFLAENIGNCSAFLELSWENAKAVLAQDDLVLGWSTTNESQVLDSVREWIKHKPGRESQAAELLESVRLSLLRVREVLDFQEELETSEIWLHCKERMSVKLREALDDRLSAEPLKPQKRKFTAEEDCEEDTSLLKVLRVARSVYRPSPTDTPS